MFTEQSRTTPSSSPVLYEELKDQGQSAAAAQKGAVNLMTRSNSREEVRVEHMELPDACVEIDATRATTECRRPEGQALKIALKREG